MVATSPPKHVVAVAGRRIDPEPAQTRRFPFERVSKVERDLHHLFEELSVSILISSAAYDEEADFVRRIDVRWAALLPGTKMICRRRLVPTRHTKLLPSRNFKRHNQG